MNNNFQTWYPSIVSLWTMAIILIASFLFDNSALLANERNDSYNMQYIAINIPLVISLYLMVIFSVTFYSDIFHEKKLSKKETCFCHRILYENFYAFCAFSLISLMWTIIHFLGYKIENVYLIIAHSCLWGGALTWGFTCALRVFYVYYGYKNEKYKIFIN